jgi:cellulose synthase operon protein C
MVASEDFGTARMLLHGGVDKFSLADRLRALDDGQKETLRSRYQSQWAWVQTRVDEIRCCQKHLLHQTYHHAYEEHWLKSLPLEPRAYVFERTWLQGPFTDDDIEAIEQQNEHPASILASMALLHNGKVDHDRMQRVLAAAHDDGDQAVDALWALVQPACWSYLLGQHRWSMRDLLRVVRERQAACAPHARAPLAMLEALLLCMYGRSEQPFSEELKEHLESLLRHERPGIAVHAAVLLERVDLLRDALLAPSASAEDVEWVLHCLARVDGAWLRAQLLRLPMEIQRRGAAHVHAPGEEDEWHTAVALLRRLPAEDREKPLQGLLSSLSSANEEQKSVFGAWWVEHAATCGSDSDVVQALERVTSSLRVHRDHAPLWLKDYQAPVATLLRDAADKDHWGWTELLRFGTEDVWPALLPLARDPSALACVLSCSLVVEHHREDKGIDASWSQLRLWQWLWAHSDVRSDVLDQAVHACARSHQYLNGATEVRDWLWGLLANEPKQRARIWAITEPWRNAFIEWRAQQAWDSPLRPRSAAAHMRLYAPLYAPSLWHLAIEVRERLDENHDDEDLCGVLDATFEAALPSLRAHPRDTMATTFRVGSYVADGFCEHMDDPRWRSAGERFRVHARRLLNAAKDGFEPVDPNEIDASSMLEDFEVRLRLMDEAQERFEPAPTPTPTPAPTSVLPTSPPTVQLVVPRMRYEPTTSAAVPSLFADERAGHGAAWCYMGECLSMDTQMLAEGTQLPTLLDYVSFIVEMQRGGDIMKMLAARHMDVAAWTSAATVWGSVMSQRTDVALRMAMLMQGPWDKVNAG